VFPGNNLAGQQRIASWKPKRLASWLQQPQRGAGVRFTTLFAVPGLAVMVRFRVDVLFLGTLGWVNGLSIYSLALICP